MYATEYGKCRSLCRFRYGGTRKGARTKIGQSLFQMGYKLCPLCDVFIKAEYCVNNNKADGGSRCPCCRRKMRAKPVASDRYKAKHGYWNKLREAATID